MNEYCNNSKNTLPSAASSPKENTMKSLVNTQSVKKVTLLKRTSRLFFLFLFLGLSGFVNSAVGQSYIAAKGVTTICQGESTTIQVYVTSSSVPYTIVYSDGTSNHTVSNYYSYADPDKLPYGGDAITVLPTVTTTYSLVSVTDQWNNPLPVSAATVTITVNPVPTALVITPGTRVCPSVAFDISATATNGSTYELWNAANTTKTSNLPYNTSITTATSYTVRAISSLGCTTSQAYTINIDNTPPTISCPGNQTINPGTGTCVATIPDYRGSVTVSDNCTAQGSIVLVQSPASGATLTGNHTNQLVTITATDAAGNSNSCSFTVTVEDNINPGITCVSNQIVSPGAGTCIYTHSGTAWNAVGSDNCALASVTYALSGATVVASNPANTSLAGRVFQAGTTTVTWTATDVNGNTAQCSFTVSIDDSEKPAVSCVTNKTVNTASGTCTYTKSGTDWNVTATDNCTVSSITYELTGATTGTILNTLNGAVFNKGVTSITCTVADGATVPNTNTCSFSVTVNDVQNPTVTCPSNITTTNTAGTCSKSVVVPDATFGDNCTGSSIAWASTGATILSGSGQVGTQTFNVGITTITYTVTDASSNIATCSFTVTVSDTELPTITCPGNISASSSAGTCAASVVIPDATFGDNCTGSSIAWASTGATVLSGSGQVGTKTFNIGVTTVTITVTDGASNTANCSFTVTITDTEDPTITCPAPVVVSNATGACNQSVIVPSVVFGDNCSGSSLTWSTTGATTLSGSGQMGTQTFNVGVTTVTFTVTDAAARTASCNSYTVTVNDTEKPVIVGTPVNKVLSSNAGSCNATVSWTEPTATDNCTAANSLVWTKSHLPGASFSPGVNTVTYTATDAADNISNVYSFTVTVNDNQKPIISGCPANKTQAVDAGACSAVVSWTEPTATDNCTSSGSFSLDEITYPRFNISCWYDQCCLHR